jgi:hypothetical protein
MSRLVCALVIAMFWPWAAQAQALRDPTQPPGASTSGAEGLPTADASATEGGGMAVVVRGGKPMLVQGTRLYGVGQTFGRFRVERISETEIWLREGGDLRKISRFAGIERHAARPLADCAAPAKKSSKPAPPSRSTSPQAAPCAGAQP